MCRHASSSSSLFYDTSACIVVVDFERGLDLVKMGSESGRYLFTVLPPNKLPKAVVGKRRISHLPATGGIYRILAF